MQWVTPDTWLISDTHWEHPKIRLYGDRPEDHFELMHKNWIETVGENDDLLHLGDLVCFGNRDAHPTWLRGLTGNKRMIRGNHDDHTYDWYAAVGFHVVGRKRQLVHLDGKIISFSHEPDEDDGAWDLNIHGHIHINPYYSGTLRVEDRINVSVEKINYTPVKLGDLLPW